MIGRPSPSIGVALIAVVTGLSVPAFHPGASAGVSGTPGAAGAPAAATVAVPSEGLPPPSDDWYRIRTDHFTFFSNAPEKRTLEIARSLERYIQVLAVYYKQLRVEAAVPGLVYIFKHHDSFEPYMARFEGKSEEWGGVFTGWRDGNYMAMNAEAGDDPLDVIYHEYTHFFLHNNQNRWPLWFEEGLGECHSTFQPDAAVAHIGKPDENHLTMLRNRTLMPVEELVSFTGRSEMYHRADDRRGLFYAESWALVHYLLWGRKEGRIQLADFFARLDRGEDPGPAFTEAFRTAARDLTVELRRYLDQRRFQYSTLKYESLSDPKIDPPVAMSRSEVLFRLGDLLAHLGHDEGKAEAHFRRALAIDPRHAKSHGGLAWLALQRGDAAAAVDHCDRALALDAEDSLINFHCAEAHVARSHGGGAVPGGPASGEADLARAQALFMKSLQRNPGFGEAFVGFGVTAAMTEGGDLKPAIRLLEGARHLLPSRADVVANLAILYDRDGRHDRARELVEEVLPRMGDPEALRSARDHMAAPPREPRDRTPSDRPNDSGGAMPDKADLIRALEEALAGEKDPAKRKALEETIAVWRSTAHGGSFVDVYNAAVERANRGDLPGAIRILEELLPKIPEGDLAAETRALLEKMKSDLARRKKPGGGRG